MRACEKAAGFTLIETLLAALILFGAIAVAATAFSTGFTSLRRAEESILMAGELPQLADRIAIELEAGRRQGEGVFEGFRYEWRAEPLDSRPALGKFDPETGALAASSFILHLMQVDVSLVAVAGKGPGKRFQYREVTWTQ